MQCINYQDPYNCHIPGCELEEWNFGRNEFILHLESHSKTNLLLCQYPGCHEILFYDRQSLEALLPLKKCLR